LPAAARVAALLAAAPALKVLVTSRELLEEALALAEPLRDPALTVRVLARLGRVTALQGNASDAGALLERGVALGREAGVPETAIAFVNLGRTFVLLEDLERAEGTVTEGLDLARSIGRAHLTAFAVINLALLKLMRRDYTAAASLGSEALRLARRVDFRWSINYLAMIRRDRCAQWSRRAGCAPAGGRGLLERVDG